MSGDLKYNFGAKDTARLVQSLPQDAFHNLVSKCTFGRDCFC